MRRRVSHATRNLFGLLPRRRTGHPTLSSQQVLGALRLSGKSAATIALAGLMLVFIGLLVVNFVGQVMQSARLEARRAALEAEVAAMREENARLAGAVAFAESDVYAEQVARSQLGYAREGDVVVLPRIAAAPPVDTPAPEPASVDLPLDSTPNWLRWWRAFFPPTA